MAFLNRCEHVVPLPFDICSIGVHFKREPGFFQYPLTLGDVLRQGNTDANRNNAKIHDDLHSFFYLGVPGLKARFFAGSLIGTAISAKSAVINAPVN